MSIDWLDYFEGDIRQQLDQVRDTVAERGRVVGRNAGFAIVEVITIKEAGQSYGRSVAIRTTGEAHDPSHSGIYGLTPEDDIIAQSPSGKFMRDYRVFGA